MLLCYNKYKYDTKRTLQVMKEITRNQKKKSSSLPNSKKTKQGMTKKESETANEFIKYFASIGTAFASKIPRVTKDVSEYLPRYKASIEHKELSFQQFEKAFKMLKRNKAIGCDGLKVILFKKF